MMTPAGSIGGNLGITGGVKSILDRSTSGDLAFFSFALFLDDILSSGWSVDISFVIRS